MWDINTGNCVRVLSGGASAVASVAVSNSGKLVAMGLENSSVVIWDLASGKSVTTLKGHSAPITAISFEKSDSIIASGSLDGSIRLWDMKMYVVHLFFFVSIFLFVFYIPSLSFVPFPSLCLSSPDLNCTAPLSRHALTLPLLSLFSLTRRSIGDSAKSSLGAAPRAKSGVSGQPS